MKKRYRITIGMVSIAICFIIGVYFLASLERIADIYISQTQTAIMDLKKEFLKDTVGNVINEIVEHEQADIKQWKDTINKRFAAADFGDNVSERQFEDFFLRQFRTDDEQGQFIVLMWNSLSGKVIYDSQKLLQYDKSGALEGLKAKMPYYKQEQYGDFSVLVGISRSYLDKHLQDQMVTRIRRQQFQNGAYIWVNEVLDYEGGTNYAIRRVHPNLPETEGMYLSTKTTDIKGNLPYLTELEGVKKDGEIFYTYYFKRLDRNEVSEKLTYSQLYPEYNWIISMGVHTEEIQVYAAETNHKSKTLASQLTIVLTLMLLGIVVFFISVFYLIEKMYLKHSKKQLETEMSKDPLTRACSRRCGTNTLITMFNEYKETSVSPAVMMFDVDKFKCINDTYGHNVGDRVLIEIVQTVYSVIRTSDQLVRWGGDEFVCIFNGLKQENAIYLGNKILSAISKLTIEVGDKIISPTLSMGFSYFQSSDTDFADVIKRADRAMYMAKSEGRNLVKMINED